MDEARVENQRKLTETLKRCAEKNIVLNEDKPQTGLTEIAFHGHRVTKDGVKGTSPNSHRQLGFRCQYRHVPIPISFACSSKISV